MSKPSEADRRLPLDHYPKAPHISEDDLIEGYRGIERRRPHGALGSPLRAAFDESGLLYGEPVSDGRGAVLGRRGR